MEMTLARALRYAKRVKEQISKLETDIAASNSVMKGAERDIVGTVADNIKRRDELVEHLVELKLATIKATQPVQPMILRLSEIKGKIAFLQRLNVTHGLVRDRYGESQPTEYVAEIRKLDRDKMVTDLQSQIDELQGRVDAHNANTKIVIKDAPSTETA
jgi:peptidoglycan hydrolase CwlO-like protein